MLNFALNLVLSIALSFSVYAHEAQAVAGNNPGISVAFDAQGYLWRVAVKDGFVQVDHSKDGAKTFSVAIIVNQTKQIISADGDARPNIAISPKGHIYLTWAAKLEQSSASELWFARSINAGKTFEKPYILHQNRAEMHHAFDALNVNQNGTITVIWTDNRPILNTQKASKNSAIAAIYYAVSNNHGESFAPEQKIADNSCECCQMVTTNKPDGTVVAMWRHVFESGERDFVIAEIPQDNAKPQLHRATFGHWKIDGCSHHGAALATGGEGANWWGYHMAYFDGNDKSPGLYYSRMDGVAWASSPAKKFGNNANQAGRPAILSISNKTGDEHVWLVWREIEAKNTKIIGLFSEDGGRSWSEAKELATTADKADYPQLLQHHQQVYLVWNTLKEGFKLIALKP